MTETQIYKWWWDQTRKRMKKLKSANGSIVPVSGKQDRNSSDLPFETSGQAKSIDVKKDEEKKSEYDEKIPQISGEVDQLEDKQASATKKFDYQTKDKSINLSLKRQQTSELLAAGQNFFVPAIDEFGGYSSRLRIPEIIANSEDDQAMSQLSRNKNLSAKKDAL